jgi:chromosome segregation ATPase
LDAALKKINELQDELLNIKDELDSNSQIAEKQSKKVLEMEDANSTIKALVAEYKEKNDTLTGLLAEYKGFKNEIENIKKELVHEMDARARAEKVSAEALESIDRLKDLHKDDLKKVKDTLSLEYKQAFLDVQVKHQEELSVLHNTYNSKIEELG